MLALLVFTVVKRLQQFRLPVNLENTVPPVAHALKVATPAFIVFLVLPVKHLAHQAITVKATKR